MRAILVYIIAAILFGCGFSLGHHVGFRDGYERAFTYDTDHWCELNEARLEAALGYDVVREDH